MSCAIEPDVNLALTRAKIKRKADQDIDTRPSKIIRTELAKIETESLHVREVLFFYL